jgi:hypothetical protein
MMPESQNSGIKEETAGFFNLKKKRNKEICHRSKYFTSLSLFLMYFV